MSNGRADPMADMDLSDFEPTPIARANIDVDAIREASEKQNFPSRAPVSLSPPASRPPKQTASPARPSVTPSPPVKEQRRRRTGRSHQLNLKVTTEAAQHFAKLADANKWGFGEAFEKAVAALEEKYPARD